MPKGIRATYKCQKCRDVGEYRDGLCYRCFMSGVQLYLHPLLHQVIKKLAKERQSTVNNIMTEGFLRGDPEALRLFSQLERREQHADPKSD